MRDTRTAYRTTPSICLITWGLCVYTIDGTFLFKQAANQLFSLFHIYFCLFASLQLNESSDDDEVEHK